MPFDSVAALFGYDRLDNFLAAVGAGDINGAQITNRILEAERRSQQPAFAEDQIISRAAQAPLQGEAVNGVDIMGMGGLLVTLARCCNPMPGDDIVGYITRGRGVTVHRRDCSNIRMHEEPERYVDVSWRHVAQEKRYPVPIEIVAYDREGLMRDISTIVADEQVNMSNISVSTRQDIATLRVTMELTNLQQLARILSRIECIPSVVEARRCSMV
jgi:GTP pyrophosphokinase